MALKKELRKQEALLLGRVGIDAANQQVGGTTSTEEVSHTAGVMPTAAAVHQKLCNAASDVRLLKQLLKVCIHAELLATEKQ